MALRIGLLGLGHLGKIHRRCIDELEELELTCIYDPDPDVMAQVEDHLQIESLDQLWKKVDLVDIVSPTPTHFDLAHAALTHGKHVFIEKPVTASPEQAERLLALQKSGSSIVQIGHVERFNPAMQAIKQMTLDPRFIEVHRLAQFNPRGTDVSVVLDLMIHDLDIILKLVDAPLKSIQANGVSIVSESADIGNARIEWENGCVANVTASRISLKNMRKMRIFQPDAYVALDFLDKNAQIIRLLEDPDDGRENTQVMSLDTPGGTKHIEIELSEGQKINAIKEELSQFAASVRTGDLPEVGLAEGYAALKLAHEINQQIESKQRESLQK